VSVEQPPAAYRHFSQGKKNLELRWGRGKFEV
jgi:hypothetical protein